MGRAREVLNRLEAEGRLTKDQWVDLLGRHREEELAQEVASRARALRHRWYGRDVYLRGLIEFTNHCRQGCLYCGIRRENRQIRRYRLNREEILACCRLGYERGFRTFVLQGGEDPYFTDERLCCLVEEIRTTYPDCAITLSVGERSRESYARLFAAGADRYLLRHETYNEAHYRRLHPADQSPKRRRQCLWDLKEVGFQVGSGFMVGSPGQTLENLAEDLLFLEELQPQMVGIGPFLPQRDTPFGKERAGTLELTLFLLGLIRLLLPAVLLPATTALGTLHPEGRLRGILAGANVIMPNLSPPKRRGDYALYDNKLATGAESAEGIALLEQEIARIGYRVDRERGDSKLVGRGTQTFGKEKEEEPYV